MRLQFIKAQGLGNDFVIFNFTDPSKPLDLAPSEQKKIRSARFLKWVSNRKTGVGYDQLMILTSSKRVHFKLEIYNADGSRAEMCGNGLRAAVHEYLLRVSASAKDAASIHSAIIAETDAGDLKCRLLSPASELGKNPAAFIECDMGKPKIGRKAIKLALGRKKFSPVTVNVGNPHAVYFLWPKTDKDFAAWGSKTELHRAFPNRTNVEFVKVENAHLIHIKVWERGVGITEACGTGAVASAVAAIAQGYCQSPVETRFQGGSAEVDYDPKSGIAKLRGWAHQVFSGYLEL